MDSYQQWRQSFYARSYDKHNTVIEVKEIG